MIFTFFGNQDDLALSFLLSQKDSLHRTLVVAPTYLQAKRVFNRLLEIAPTFTARRDIDSCQITDPCQMEFRGIGDGSKCNGYRFRDVVVLNFDSIDKDSYQRLLKVLGV